MRAFLGVLWLVAAAPAADPPKISLPPEVAGKVGEFLVLTAATDGKVVKFVPLDPGLTVLPPALLRDPKTFVAVAPKPGRYRVLVYTALADEPSDPLITVLAVGGDGGSDTNPPPPGAVLKTAELTAAVRSAYAADADAGKADQMRKLREAYAKAADEIATVVPATTWEQAAGLIRGQTIQADVFTKLTGVRTAVTAAIRTAAFGTDGTAMGEAGRDKLVKALKEAAAIVAEVQP